MATVKPFLLLISLLALALVSSSIPLPGGLSKGNNLCGLRFYVKTLSDPCAGTTSNVSITVSYSRGSSQIPNLVEWNILPPPQGGYFQAGHLDSLGGLVNCDPSISLIPCSLNITITGTGHSPTWGLESIKVQTSKSDRTFKVNEWLTPENNYNVAVLIACPFFSTGMSGSTKSSLAIKS